MKLKHETWGWMLAFDFFFAGMGGGMLIISGVYSLIYGSGSATWIAGLLGPAFVGMGALLLILELGRPAQMLRVFVKPLTSLIGKGAWGMTLAMGAGLVLVSFDFDIFPWAGLELGRMFFALGTIFLGTFVAAYPGVLLGNNKARPFWTGPGLPPLFFLSSLTTGAAAHILCELVAPFLSANLFSVPSGTPALLETLPIITIVLMSLQLVLWPCYLFVKYKGATIPESKAAKRWLGGSIKYTVAFWGGVILLGMMVPSGILTFEGIILQVSGAILDFVAGIQLIGLQVPRWMIRAVDALLTEQMLKAAGALLALLGGFIMRNLVVYAGASRTLLPGEEKYRSRLPKGNEAFLSKLR